MGKLTYSGSKGHYFVFDDNVTVGTIVKVGAWWDGVLIGSENNDHFMGKTRDATLALLEAVYDGLTVGDPSDLPIVIDAAVALSSLGMAVEARGADFVYREDGVQMGVAPRWSESQYCRYEWRGVASCGVGFALNILGVSVETLKGMDVNLEYPDEGSGIYNTEVPGVEMTAHARAIYTKFQQEQDQGRSWGRALERAQKLDA